MSNRFMAVGVCSVRRMKTLRLLLGDVVLLVARLALGAVLILRGWSRLMAEGGMGAQVQYLTDRQVPAPEIMAWGATIFELGGGVFLVFGLLTPLIGAVLAVEQILVIVWTNWFNGLQGGPSGPGFETNLAQASMGLAFLAFGGGRAALDNLFKRPKDDAGEQQVMNDEPADEPGQDGQESLLPIS